MQDTLNTKAFGKNDIRGIFPSEVNSELYFYVAKGYISWMQEQLTKLNGTKKPVDEILVSVCMDARLHSKELKDALGRDLVAALEPIRLRRQGKGRTPPFERGSYGQHERSHVVHIFRQLRPVYQNRP